MRAKLVTGWNQSHWLFALDGISHEGKESLGVLVWLCRADPIHAGSILDCLGSFGCHLLNTCNKIILEIVDHSVTSTSILCDKNTLCRRPCNSVSCLVNKSLTWVKSNLFTIIFTQTKKSWWYSVVTNVTLGAIFRNLQILERQLPLKYKYIGGHFLICCHICMNEVSTWPLHSP